MRKILLFSLLLLIFNSLKSQNCNGVSCLANPNILQEELITCYAELDTTQFYNCNEAKECNNVCELTEFTYTTAYHYGSSFFWTVIGGQLTSVSPTGNTITILWDSIGSGSISVTEQDTLMCSKSSTICINIIPKPLPTITTLANSDTICFGSNIYFQGVDLNNSTITSLFGDSCSTQNQYDSSQFTYELQYFWDFGDGSFSIEQNPIHIYDNPGLYSVSLTISNSCQCSDFITKDIVVVNSPGPSIISCLGPLCEGDTSEYCTDAVLPNWNVVGGILYNSFLSDSCITVVWNNQNNELNDGAGELLVGDLNSSCGQSQSFYSVPIVPLNPLISGNLIVCPGTYETFSFECIPGIDYYWTISGGWGGTIISGNNTSEILVAFDQWLGNTSFQITLYMSSSTLAFTTVPFTINVDVLPRINNFVYPTNVCEDAIVNYSDWNGSQYNWTVINGTSSIPSPSSQINVSWDQGAANGMIIVEPVNSGTYCQNSKSFPINISENPVPAVNILGDSLICPGSTYTYSVEESNSNSSLNVNYNWTITGGIASTNTGKTCTIIWDPVGPYSIDITNSLNQSPYCSSNVFTKIINTVPTLSPVVSGSSIACLNSINTFNLTTVYPSWAKINWSISNPILGSVVEGQESPQIEIEWGNQNGTTDVLIDVDVCGVTYSQNLPVTLHNQPISFSFSSNPACPGIPVIFSSTGGQGTYLWDFDDGTSSYQTNPIKSYNSAGNYLVNLTYIDSVNQCESNYSSVINIEGISGILSPEGNSFYCISNNISQTLYLTTNSPIYPSIEWFQNGISISNSNTYTVNSNPPNHNGIGNYSVILTDSNGCSNTLNSINIDTINCSSGSGWSGGGSCPSLIPLSYTSNCNSNLGNKSFNFSSPNGNTVMWRVDNGSVSSSLNFIKDFNQAGIYKVKCLYSGCLLGSEEIIVPVAVDYDYSVTCDPSNGNQITYFFNDASSYLLGYGSATYHWDFGDGSSSNLQNPSHVYASNGTYNVNLTVNYGAYSCNKLSTITVTDFNVNYSYSGLECTNTPTIIFFPVASPTNIASWNWNFGDGASSAKETPRRTYTQSGIFTTSLQVTDINGCIATETTPIIIEQNPIINYVASLGPICYNDSPIDLSSLVNFNVTNGETASWSGTGIDYNSVTQIYSFNPLQAGGGSHEIDVIVTDNNGCYDKKTIVIDVLCPEKPKIFGESEYCYESNNSQIFLFTEGVYNTYSWYRNGVSMGSSWYSIYDNIGVGMYDYIVEVLDDNGCTGFSDPFTLNMNDSPNIISVSNNINPCPNEEIILSHNGNQNNVDYYWNTLPQQTASTITVTAIADYAYYVTAKNEFGCESTSNSIIIPSEIPLCGVLSGCLCDDEIMNSAGLIDISGLNNSWQYSNYEWLLNSNPFTPSQNTSSLIIDPLDTNYLTICSGSITLAVTDNNGCSSVSNSLKIEPNCSGCFRYNTDYNISETICSGESFIFGANTYSASGTFSSNFQSINGCDSNVILDLVVLPLQTSFQNFTICDGDSVVVGTSIYYQNGIYIDTFNVNMGCDSIQITEIEISDPITNLSFNLLNPTCNGFLNGSINISVNGTTSPYTYLWITGDTTQNLQNIGSGQYSVTVSDSNNCLHYDSIVLIEPNPLFVVDSSTNVSCFGSTNASVTFNLSGGTPSYIISAFGQTFPITNPTSVTIPAIVSIPAGLYPYSITDFQGCVLQDTIAITQPNPVTNSSSISYVSCSGFNDGIINLYPLGGTGSYTFLWSTGDTTQFLNNIPSGQYFVSILDSNNCLATDTIVMLQPDIIDNSFSKIMPTCSEYSDGSINVVTSGGIPPYNYLWNTGDTSQNLQNVSAGQYIVSVLDSNSCILFDTITLLEPNAILAVDSIENISCNGLSDGSINLLIVGGTGNYNLNWETGDTISSIINLVSDWYKISITDSNNCLLVDSFFVQEPTLLEDSVSTTTATCFGFSNGAASVFPFGSVSPYSYLWSTGDTSQFLQNITAGLYSVIITDYNNCTLYDTLNVDEPLILSYNEFTDSISCFGKNDGLIDLTINGGIPPYAYLWNTGDTTQDISNLIAGTYIVNVIDSNGCLFTANISIYEPDELLSFFNLNYVSCFGLSNGNIDGSTFGGTQPYFFSWNTGQNTEDLFNISSDMYIVSVTDTNQCFFTDTILVFEPNILESSLTISSGSLVSTASGGTVPYTYEIYGPTGLFATTSNNMGISFIINPTLAGTYTLVVIDANGCVDSSEVNILPSSVVDLNSISDIYLFPNPSRGLFKISFKSDKNQDLSIRIFSVVAGEVYREDRKDFVGEYTKKISLDNYGKGIYFLEIETNTGIVNKKLILQ